MRAQRGRSATCCHTALHRLYPPDGRFGCVCVECRTPLVYQTEQNARHSGNQRSGRSGPARRAWRVSGPGRHRPVRSRATTRPRVCSPTAASQVLNVVASAADMRVTPTSDKRRTTASSMFWGICLSKMAHDEVRQAEVRQAEERRRRSPPPDQREESNQSRTVSRAQMGQGLMEERHQARSRSAEGYEGYEATEAGKEADVDATSMVDMTCHIIGRIIGVLWFTPRHRRITTHNYECMYLLLLEEDDSQRMEGTKVASEPLTAATPPDILAETSAPRIQ